MISLEPEISRLRDDGILTEAAAERLIAIERRTIFSVHPELRVLAWAAVTLFITGLGILLHENFDRLGPPLVLTSIIAAATGCYGFVIWRERKKPHLQRSLVHDSALLLAALLASAAIGYAESAYHLLDDNWSWHLILIAVLHGCAAYYFNSRVLLTLSITALAAFLGINYEVIHTNLFLPYDLAIRAYICAGILLAWRTANLRFSKRTEFTEVFDHTMAILVLVAALILIFEDDSLLSGLVFLVAGVVAVFLHGWRNRSQAFIIYAVIALLVGVGNLVTEVVGSEAIVFLYVLLSTVVAIIFLFSVRARFREEL